jgi:outer membrane protein OmpA-like peptidoglycan-associated protein
VTTRDTRRASAHASALVTSGVLQRSCASCGQHSVAGNECSDCEKKKGLLQRTTSSEATHEALPIVHDVLRSSGQPLDHGTRAFMEQRFEFNFANVRVHTEARAAQSASRIGAFAYTANESLVFSQGRYAPQTPGGQHLLAHELAHVVQQKKWIGTAPQATPLGHPRDPAEAAADSAADLIMNNSRSRGLAAALSATPTGTIQRTVDDPQRFQQINQSLFVSTPGGGGGVLQPWVDPSPGVQGTSETLFRQAKANIRQDITQNPQSIGGTIPTRTTEADLDTDAVDINQQIRARFPMISVTIPDAQLRSSVSVMTPALTNDPDYLHEWLANKLPGWSDSENFNISETDARFVALLDRLLADADVGPALHVLASRQSGFERGQGLTREIFLHRGTDPQTRRAVLFHELTHFYAHQAYRDWVATTTNERWYNEGFTEYLARLAMPAAMRNARVQYGNRVTSINTQVAAHVPDTDIARAYFLGEVWRLETRSTIARREAEAQLGLSATATAREEQEASRTGPGINQTVVPGRRYRFMNIGFDQAAPKPEHVSFFRAIRTRHLDPAPTMGLIFEGHASSAGALDYNRRLSLRRARAFYQMARQEGLAPNRLINANNPPHFGETRPTAQEEDPVTRAFNRRVEMEIQPTSP